MLACTIIAWRLRAQCASSRKHLIFLAVHVDARGPMPVVLQGALYHKISALQPPSGTVPAFARVYIYDTDNELKNCLKFNLSKGKKNVDKLDREFTERLQKLMHTKSLVIAPLSRFSSLHWNACNMRTQKPNLRL